MVISKNKLLEMLVKEFSGQKICVLNAPDDYDFLSKLQKKVHVVFNKKEIMRESIVGVVCFGAKIECAKKVFLVATALSNVFSHNNFIICPEFLNLNKTEICAVISDYALNGFNFLCRKIFDVDFTACRQGYFEFLKQILNKAETGNKEEICTMLAKLSECNFSVSQNGSFLERIVCNFLNVSLCEFFLNEKPFHVIFSPNSLSLNYGINFCAALNYDETCFKLKEFRGDFLSVCKKAKDCIFCSLKTYKRSRKDAGFLEIKNLKANILIKKMLQNAAESASMVGVIQGLGLV